jgi:hypothetical protein
VISLSVLKTNLSVHLLKIPSVELLLKTSKNSKTTVMLLQRDKQDMTLTLFKNLALKLKVKSLERRMVKLKFSKVVVKPWLMDGMALNKNGTCLEK